MANTRDRAYDRSLTIAFLSRWRASVPDPEFSVYGIPYFAWDALGVVALAALLRWRSLPAPRFAHVLFLILGLAPFLFLYIALPDEVAGGTYTMTNVGTFGNVLGTPVINQPQVAIMATGAIRKKPAVIETPQGDLIGIRHQMFLSHSYDHRVVDGALGGRFVRRVADLLEAWDLNAPF